MATVSALFFDVGGVVLTNGWDRQARLRAAEAFHLDWDEFQRRHDAVVADFETGRIGLDEYLNRTVFYELRPFTREQFREFMFAQSKPCDEALAVVAALADTNRYLMATLSNESRELNRYRIERFRLRDYFDVFFSSCYLGVRKPEERIYRLALDITQRHGSECLFIDDRPENLEGAERAGIPAILYRDAGQLEEEFRCRGVLSRGIHEAA